MKEVNMSTPAALMMLMADSYSSKLVLICPLKSACIVKFNRSLMNDRSATQSRPRGADGITE